MPTPRRYHTLRLILGDQLNASHSWYKEKDADTLYLIAELPQEMGYVHHHIQKAVAFMAGMQQFAQALEKAGHAVCYLTLDDTAAWGDLPEVITQVMQQHGIAHFEYQRPDEYRLSQQLASFSPDMAGFRKLMVETEHFVLAFDELADYFPETVNAKTGKPKHYIMEFFYRKLRKRFNLLMQGEGKLAEPLGGQWNFDKDNRNKLKKEDLADIPVPLVFENDVTEFVARLEHHKVKTIGRLPQSQDGSNGTCRIGWPITRKQALALLDFFCEQCLPRFGTFQDAMTCQSDHAWSLYHSRLSFAINAKMLSPMRVIQHAVVHFEKNQDRISLSQIEGFVRQILGWREYMRGIYWQFMPDYAVRNALAAERPLPSWFWTGETNMRCLKAAIDQSLDHAYAHHIQRLMVTGNFCLLAGIHPDDVDAWYLGIYIDAIEWVELPNTRGMSQFADGGIVATKPYAASGNYTNKMSDYCKNCSYNVSKKIEDNACPLNSLYWQFMVQHRERLSENPRIGMIYRNWDKQSEEQQQAVLDRAGWCLDNLAQL